MAVSGGRCRNRPDGAAIRGDLNLPETSGLNRRGWSGQVIESGAAGLVRRRSCPVARAGRFAEGVGRHGVRGQDRIRHGKAIAGASTPAKGAACERRGSIGPGFEFEVSAFGVVDRHGRSPDGG